MPDYVMVAAARRYVILSYDISRGARRRRGAKMFMRDVVKDTALRALMASVLPR